MNHNLLLLEGPPFPLDTRDRVALGIPSRLIPLGAGWIVRAEGVPEKTAGLLLTAARDCGGRTTLSGRRGVRGVVLEVPPRAWRSFLKRLSSAPSSASPLKGEIQSLERSLRRPAARIRLARRRLRLGGRTLIQGILNVTPDSFYDGGRWADPARAVERAFQMVEEGAGIIDVGGESTRPGSRAVPAREEIRRILPVIERLVGRLRVPVSVDTTKSEVAEAALSAGAEIVNDVSGLTFDPRIARVASRHRAALIISHIRGRPRSMQRNPRYRHLVPEVLAFLRAGIERAMEAGVHPESILIDPGIGFGKTAEHNLLLLRHLRALRCAGRPILVGASRKSFLGKILGGGPVDRLEGSLAAAALAVFNGAAVLRVHDVASTRRVARVAESVRDGRIGPNRE